MNLHGKKVTIAVKRSKTKGVDSMARRRKRPGKSNRRGMFAITVIVMVLLVGLLIQSQELILSNKQYESRKEELEQQIRDEEIRSGEIENMKDYVDSIEYIEKLAREKLGLVYEDETIFKAED